MYKFEYDYEHSCLKCTQSGFWTAQDVDSFLKDLIKTATFYTKNHAMVGLLTDARHFEIQSKEANNHLDKVFHQDLKIPFKQAVIISSQLQKMQMKRVLSTIDDIVFLHDMVAAELWLQSLPKPLP